MYQPVSEEEDDDQAVPQPLVPPVTIAPLYQPVSEEDSSEETSTSTEAPAAPVAHNLVIEPSSLLRTRSTGYEPVAEEQLGEEEPPTPTSPTSLRSPSSLKKRNITPKKDSGSSGKQKKLKSTPKTPRGGSPQLSHFEAGLTQKVQQASGICFFCVFFP